MNFNNPPSGYGSQLNWSVNAIQALNRRVTSILQNGSALFLPQGEIPFGNFDTTVETSPLFYYSPGNTTFNIGFGDGVYNYIHPGAGYFLGDILYESQGGWCGISEAGGPFPVNTWEFIVIGNGYPQSYRYIAVNPSNQSLGDIDGVQNAMGVFIDNIAATSKLGVSNTFGWYGNVGVTVDATTQVTSTVGGVATPTMVVINDNTIGFPNAVIPSTARGIYYDPSVFQNTANITLPTTPTDGQEVIIILGGTIATNSVVALITFVVTGTQSLVFTPRPIDKAGTIVTGKYREDIDTWYIY
jgi:hypothetical protein